MEGLILVRGAGDLATGVLHRLVRCGWPVLALEQAEPSAVRRRVAFSTAVWEGNVCVEGVTARRVSSLTEAAPLWERGEVPVLVDPLCDCLRELSPAALVDGILAKRNLGTGLDMASFVVALGPGFTVGRDCHAIVETMRGADLGRVLYEGSARENTGVPGLIGGYRQERVLRAPALGRVRVLRDIGSRVEAGELVAEVEGRPVTASLAGTVRGMLPEGFTVTRPRQKLGDVDPRPAEQVRYDRISDKARCIAGGVVEVLLTAGRYPRLRVERR